MIMMITNTPGSLNPVPKQLPPPLIPLKNPYHQPRSLSAPPVTAWTPSVRAFTKALCQARCVTCWIHVEPGCSAAFSRAYKNAWGVAPLRVFRYPLPVVTGQNFTVFCIFFGQFFTDFAQIKCRFSPVFLSTSRANLAMFRSELREPFNDNTHIHTIQTPIRRIIKRLAGSPRYGRPPLCEKRSLIPCNDHFSQNQSRREFCGSSGSFAVFCAFCQIVVRFLFY